MTRFLVEIFCDDNWVSYKILTRSPDIRNALNRLPYLIKGQAELEHARIRRLCTNVQVADAKIEITRLWGVENLET